MSERVNAYFENLKNRSSEDLDLQSKELVFCEKQNALPRRVINRIRIFFIISNYGFFSKLEI